MGELCVEVLEGVMLGEGVSERTGASKDSRVSSHHEMPPPSCLNPGSTILGKSLQFVEPHFSQ